MSYIGREPLGGEVILMNSIESQFNGVLTTFNLTRTVSGVTSAFYPVGSQQLLVSLGGVIQRPDPTGDTGFRISFNTIIFAVAPVAGASCFIISYGNLIDIGAPANNTVTTDKLVDGSVTPAKLSTGGPWWLSNGNVGIGTTDPGSKLHVKSTGVDYVFIENTSSTNVGLRFKNSIRDWYLLNDSNGDVQFYNGTANAVRLKLTSDGNVGIGTANPAQKLHVYGSGDISAIFKSTNAGAEISLDATNGYAALRIFASGTETWRVGNAGQSSSFQIHQLGVGDRLTINSSGNVGIGTTNPQSKLDVIGDALINSIKAGRGGGNQLTNTAFGYQTLDSNFSGSNNVAIGYRALYVNSSGLYNVAVGTTALNSNTSGEANVAIGQQALYTNTTGIQNTAVGFTSLYSGNGTQNTALGFQTLFSNSNGGTNLALGSAALFSNSSGSSNASLGAYAGYSNTSGSYNVYCGSWVGTTTTVSRRILIGTGTDFSNRFEGPNTASNVQLAIGHNISGTSNYWIVGDSNYNVGIGTATPGFRLEVNGSFAATTKSFIIPHPTKENYKLRHGSLEGPENGVYVRGRTSTNTIELPDYWTGLVDADSITVNLTPIGNRHIWVEEINNNKVYINSEDTIDCFYTVFAERKDVEKLIVEIEEN